MWDKMSTFKIYRQQQSCCCEFASQRMQQSPDWLAGWFVGRLAKLARGKLIHYILSANCPDAFFSSHIFYLSSSSPALSCKVQFSFPYSVPILCKPPTTRKLFYTILHSIHLNSNKKNTQSVSHKTQSLTLILPPLTITSVSQSAARSDRQTVEQTNEQTDKPTVKLSGNIFKDYYSEANQFSLVNFQLICCPLELFSTQKIPHSSTS